MAHERKLNVRYGVRYKLKQLLSQSSNMFNTVPKNVNKEIVDLTFNLLSCIYERFHIFPSKTFPNVWFSSPFFKPENHSHF